MVKGVVNNVTTLYVSSAYQITDGVVTKYYPGGAFRVDGVLYYALSDHLGSTSVTTNANGVKTAEMYYTAWGEVRYTIDSALTDKTYTGQRSYAKDFGLMYYNARWYDPGVGRFAQADTIVPGGMQGLDRYAYVNNSPVNFTDPSGHCTVDKDCWQAYDEAIAKLGGQKPDGLDQWNTADLLNLISWLNRGIRFISTPSAGIFDPLTRTFTPGVLDTWTASRLKMVLDGLNYAQAYLGNKTDQVLGLSNGGHLTFNLLPVGTGQGGSASPWDNRINLRLFSASNPYGVFTVLHEIGHFVSYNLGTNGQSLSDSQGWLNASGWMGIE